MNDYQNLFSLERRTALVSGGTGGLGHAIAEAFLDCGAHVAVCGRNPEKANDLAAYAKKKNLSFMALRCDICDEKDIADMLDIIEKSMGGIHILVNSVGMNQLLPAEDYDAETFLNVMNLNVTATHLLTRAVGKRFMIPAEYGRIVNLSSVKGTLGTQADYLAYCTSKGAINMYTKQLACEWGKYYITCNAIAPTFVRTPINSFQLDDPVFYKNLMDRIPLGRIGQARDIAAAAVYLCSDAASFVTGQILGVDGGLTARQ